MDFIYVIAFVVLIVKVVNLSGDVSSLRRDVRNLSTGKSEASSSKHEHEAVTSTPNAPFPPLHAVQAQSAFAPRSTKHESDSGDVFMNWFKENWLLKVGVIMILVGFGWFISYAFVHNWIGPAGRVMLGFFVGSILALIGTMRLGKDDIAGTMLIVLGSAIVVITSFAAQVVYDFFPPMVALVIPFIVSVCLTMIAIAYDKSKIAIYAVLIGLLSPLFTHAEIDINVIYMYLGVVALGSVWVAGVKNWREINALSLLGTLFYTVPYMLSYNSSVGFEQNYFVLAVIFGLAIMYFAVSIVAIVRSKQEASQADVMVAVFNAALIMGATVTFIPEEIRSLTLAAWMLLFAFGSFFVFSHTGKEKFFYIYSLVAVMFLAIATSIELEGESLVIAFAFESVIISISSYIITRSKRVGYSMSAFMALPAFLALPSLSIYHWNGIVLNSHFFVVFTVGALLMLMGLSYYLLRNEPSSKLDEEVPKTYVAHLVIGAFYLMALIWVSLHVALMDSSMAIIVSMVIYTIVGISSYFRGIFASNKAFSGFGSAVLLLVIARLVLVDVWSMPLAPRIVTFVVIGVLFISTAFLTKKKIA